MDSTITTTVTVTDERVDECAGSSDVTKERKTFVPSKNLRTLVGRKDLRCSFCEIPLTFYNDGDDNCNFCQNAVRVEAGNELTGPYFVQNGCVSCFTKDVDFLMRFKEFYSTLLAKKHELLLTEEKRAALLATIAELKRREGALKGHALRDAIMERTSLMSELTVYSRRVEALKAYLNSKHKIAGSFSRTLKFMTRFGIATFICCTANRLPVETKIEKLVNDPTLVSPEAAYERIQSSQQTRRPSRIDPRTKDAEDSEFVEDDDADADEEDTASNSDMPAQKDSYAARAARAAAFDEEVRPVKNVYAPRPKAPRVKSQRQKNALPTFTPADLNTIEMLRSCGVEMAEIMLMLKK